MQHPNQQLRLPRLTLWLLLCALIHCPHAHADTIKHQITGLFATERAQDLRATFAKIPDIKLVSIDYQNAEATLEYDPAKVFPGAKPEQIVQRLDALVRSASSHTFGVKPLRTLPLDRLKLIEIAVGGLDCKACALAAYEAVHKLDGVERATASFRAGRVTALVDPEKIDRALLVAALKKKGVETVVTVTNSIGLKMVLIPMGEFMMGSASSDKDAQPDELPQHRVRITRPFYMGAYEVTQEELRRVLGRDTSFFSPSGFGKDKVAGMNTQRFPAEQVRWHDAVEFCRRLSELPEEKQAGRVYRLPTEAEWEYACRAGTTTAFHVGESLSSTQANFNGNHPHGGAAKGPFLVRTSAVGSYPANAFGLHDMHGNVWEWCSDWYAVNSYKDAPLDDPPGPRAGSMRVIRGGEWYGDGRDCRSAFRYAEIPDGIFYVMGFRVVMTLGGAGPTAALDKKAERPAFTAPRALPRAATSEDWPGWRGPRGDGTWKGPDLPDTWPAAGLPVIWRQPVGGGYAGIAAAKGRVYTLDYQAIPGKKDQGTERVLCFEAAGGKLLWSHAYPVNYKGLAYGSGPRATPTLHGRRIYALGAVGHLHCLDAVTGAVLWSKDLVKDMQARKPGWGFAASPLVHDNLVIVHAGAVDGCYVAFDAQTGKEIWRSLADSVGYATPILITYQGAAQLVCWTPTNVRGLEPRTGKLLWSIPFEVTYSTSIATPIFQDGTVLVSGYYEGSKAIRPAEKGRQAEVLWHDRSNLRGLMSQPLYKGGHAYLLDRRHGLTCFELKTGKKLWDDGHAATPKGRNPQATLVWLGDHDRAVILNSDGELILARLSTAGYQELSRTAIIGPTWAHPAYAGDCVFARDDSELVCVYLRVLPERR